MVNCVVEGSKKLILKISAVVRKDEKGDNLLYNNHLIYGYRFICRYFKALLHLIHDEFYPSRLQLQQFSFLIPHLNYLNNR